MIKDLLWNLRSSPPPGLSPKALFLSKGRRTRPSYLPVSDPLNNGFRRIVNHGRRFRDVCRHLPPGVPILLQTRVHRLKEHPGLARKLQTTRRTALEPALREDQLRRQPWSRL